ncbi:MAG: Cof-type HAD-IIB family hydrolase [Gemmiger sp.]|nr:Cof-type HAD-IIB family hydrolase [Gemmiger sp.]
MQYKVLALDLDGTLTNSRKVITPRTQAALRQAAAAGVRIVLASGRPTVGIAPLAKALALQESGGCILSYNGGKILDCTTGEVLVQHAFPPALVGDVCAFARQNGVAALTYDSGGVVSEHPGDAYVQEEARINAIPIRQVADLAKAVDFAVNKFLLVGDPARMPHVEERMQQQFAGKLSIYRSQPFFLEIMPLGVEKSASLGLLLGRLGLTPANLMACGDGWNDLPMLRFAGLGVAMENAVPEVKVAADYVTADNDHDGVGLAVEKFILGKEGCV